MGMWWIVGYNQLTSKLPQMKNPCSHCWLFTWNISTVQVHHSKLSWKAVVPFTDTQCAKASSRRPEITSNVACNWTQWHPSNTSVELPLKVNFRLSCYNMRWWLSPSLIDFYHCSTEDQLDVLSHVTVLNSMSTQLGELFNRISMILPRCASQVAVWCPWPMALTFVLLKPAHLFIYLLICLLYICLSLHVNIIHLPVCLPHTIITLLSLLFFSKPESQSDLLQHTSSQAWCASPLLGVF